jgi:very-short-patch-repair endonuclease
MRRPFASWSIDRVEAEAERLVAEGRGLEQVKAELEFRKTERALKLKKWVDAATRRGVAASANDRSRMPARPEQVQTVAPAFDNAGPAGAVGETLLDRMDAAARAPDSVRVEAAQLHAQQRESEGAHAAESTNDPDAVSALRSLLDYLSELLRANERVPARLADVRYGARRFLQRRSALEGLPGVTFDLGEPEAPVWVSVSRLRREAAPLPDPIAAPWVTIKDDPDAEPIVRQVIQRIVSAEEKTRLIAAGHAVETDFEPARGGYLQEVRLREDRAAAVALEAYLNDVWRPWAEQERPRRRTIRLYDELFLLHRAIAAGGEEGSVEIVFGLRLTHWAGVEWPLVMRRAELDMDERGTFALRPRTGPAAEPLIDLRPFRNVADAQALDAADAALRERLPSLDEAPGPFNPEVLEDLVSVLAARLDRDGQTAGVAASDGVLTITPEWAVFARRRSTDFQQKDLSALKAAVERDPLTGVAERLVYDASQFEGGDQTTEDQDASPPFFPLPFNEDQVRIVRRLERAEGLVVQGPPGTGKTHTIANIVCHNLAMGRRVLVVSHGESALSVLKDKLPAEVADLTVSLTSSDRAGLDQTKRAVQALNAAVSESDPQTLALAVDQAARTLNAAMQRREQLDRTIELSAASQAELSVEGGETGWDLARRLVDEAPRHVWFEDEPTVDFGDTFTSDELETLRFARRQAGEDLRHLDDRVPDAESLLDVEQALTLHEDLTRASRFERVQTTSDQIAAKFVDQRGEEVARALISALLDAAKVWSDHRARPVRGLSDPFGFSRPRPQDLAWAAEYAEACRQLKERLGRFVARPVSAADALSEDAKAAAVLSRLAGGRAISWLPIVGEAARKPLFEAVRVAGSPVALDPSETWAHVLEWGHFRRDVEALRTRRATLGLAAPELSSEALAAARTLVEEGERLIGAFSAADAITHSRETLEGVWPNAAEVQDATADPEALVALCEALQNKRAAARLVASKRQRDALLRLAGRDLIGERLRNILERFGHAALLPETLAQAWSLLLSDANRIRGRASHFETIRAGRAALTACGASDLAEAAARPSSAEDLFDKDVEAAWTWKRAVARVRAAGGRESLAKVLVARLEAERAVGRAQQDLVVALTRQALQRRATNEIRTNLQAFVSALARLGKGTGASAGKFQRAAQAAMARCYSGVPCWIMPSWRVAETLPAELGAFDLVIMDEASQSGPEELGALLRGRKLLIVGDDQQVSPTVIGVTNDEADRLSRRYLDQIPEVLAPFLLPGSSIYELMSVLFADGKIMLREHFRCVEPIIRFSSQFYPSPLLPLRVPGVSERMDPPLIDIYVEGGVRRPNSKLNTAEADVIVEEIAELVNDPAERSVGPKGRPRSLGVISLVGAEQAKAVEKRLLTDERIGPDAMERHRIRCGDSATFQGDERDVIFLSMVNDPAHKIAWTLPAVRQRVNVALSRARERMILVRSIGSEHLSNPEDLKLKVLSHFAQPMAGAGDSRRGVLERCESGFERAVAERLLAQGYRVRPQVGAQGYRIDLVVEGANDRRLAVECDGDRYHGPDQWSRDMARQRVLERVGWRFWRCWGSDFALDPDGCLADLIDRLNREGIETTAEEASIETYVERRVVRVSEHAAGAGSDPNSEEAVAPAAVSPSAVASVQTVGEPDAEGRPIGLGHLVTVQVNGKTRAYRLVSGESDLDAGRLSVSSPLGQALLGAFADDTVEYEVNGATVQALVISVDGEG